MKTAAVVTLLVASAVLAGCISADDGPTEPTTVIDPVTMELDAVSFLPKLIIDDVRAGGEPVIAISQAGSILVSAHPGWTHYHPSSDPTHVGLEILTPANAQSYLWKSTDGGQTWRHIGLPMLEQGPRSTGFGVSDPEFTVMADGTICYTDLEGLAMSSVSCSTDDGETWIGNPIASGRPNDRQWLASHGDELYFTANYFTDHNILASTDRGLTWETRGDVPCSGDIIADPEDGTIYAGCGGGLAVSEDGGRTWEVRHADDSSGRHMTEPAIDAAGNVWVGYTDGDSIRAAGTPDKGLTWPWKIDLTDAYRALRNTTAPADEIAGDTGNGTFVWPWISAGSEGRFAVTWIGSWATADPDEHYGPWHMFTAFVANGTGTPVVQAYHVNAPDQPIHIKPICQSGTGCQVSSMQGNPSGDRRLGDFFETTIDLEGNLHIVVSDTYERSEDVISHVAYFKQSGGFPLYVEGDRAPTQG